MIPQASGTRVVHELEFNAGGLMNLLMKMLYPPRRCRRIVPGMEQTLQNIKPLVERRLAVTYKLRDLARGGYGEQGGQFFPQVATACHGQLRQQGYCERAHHER